MNKILVTFASKYGSTREVAEAVAATLRECGLTVDVRPVKQVQSVADYQAIILGAPLYFGAWHKEAVNFLTQQREALAVRPVAVFALGPTHNDQEEFQASQAMLDGELKKIPWLAPIAIGLFGGKYDPARLHLPDKLIASLPASPLHGMPASDARDWNAVRAWTRQLAANFEQVEA